MATVVWNDSAEDGDWSNASNWTGGVPTSSDIAIIATGGRAINAGLAQGAVTLAALIVTDEFAYGIGTSSGSLVIHATTMRLAGTSSSTGYYFDGNYTSVFITDASSVASAEGVFLEGTIGTLRVYKGKAKIVDAADITTIECGSGENASITLTIGASVTSLTDLRMMGGTCSIGSAVTNVWAKKGTLTITEGAVSRLEIDGATVNYTSNDTLSTGRLFSGKLDLTDAVTVGLTITNLDVWNGTLDLRNGLGEDGLTFTNPIRVHSGNASILRDKGVAA